MADKRVAVSGGFDPAHIGHYKMLEEAFKYGKVIVILNSDEWLLRKKGYKFMSFEERKYILESCKWVDEVVLAKDDDGTVTESLKDILPDYFANGGDRKGDNTPEVIFCQENGIELLWNVGGDKIQSSSSLVKEAKRND